MPADDKFILVKIFFPALVQKSNFVSKVFSVSSENRMGKFDILPQHINFITLIFNKISVQTLNREKIEFKFERGVLIARENEVRVFLGV